MKILPGILAKVSVKLSLKLSFAVCLTLLIFGGVMLAAAEEGHPAGRDNETERAALMRLYKRTQGRIWLENWGWGSSDSYCDWYGVTCDAAHHVIALELAGNLLAGRLPADIEDLIALQRLDLSNNELEGPLPEELGNLAQLRLLDLSHNIVCLKYCSWTLGGTIPASLGQLSKLQMLDLSGNALQGAVPTQLGDLDQLLTLDLSYNSHCMFAFFPPYLMTCQGGLSGMIPARLSEMFALQTLRLQGNESLCWETVAARNWALALPLYTGATDCSYMPLINR